MYPRPRKSMGGRLAQMAKHDKLYPGLSNVSGSLCLCKGPHCVHQSPATWRGNSPAKSRRLPWQCPLPLQGIAGNESWIYRYVVVQMITEQAYVSSGDGLDDLFKRLGNTLNLRVLFQDRVNPLDSSCSFFSYNRLFQVFTTEPDHIKVRGAHFPWLCHS